MRLALKVVLATVLGVLSVLVGFGWFKVQREIALFDSDMRKDHRLIGATLAVCVADTWASSSETHALALIARADAERPGIRIAWIRDDGRQDPRPPVFDYGNSQLPNQVDQIVRSDPAHPDGTHYLVTRIPVRNGNRQLGAVEIAESLDVRDAYIKASIWYRVEVTAVMLLVSGVIVLVLGVWLVGKPLRQLAHKAKRIGQGDLGGPLKLTQRDEIGELAHEMNAMCERLSEATAKGEAATGERIRAIEQLRHADRLSTVGRLAAGVAHELGTPLNVIAGRIKMLRRGGLEPTLAEEYLAIVAEQTERMTAIIRQLMELRAAA
ncbi:MAG: histidine kinase dimerization/phospho-acceptor domain-containing protein [Polyangiaceae bacterium]